MKQIFLGPMFRIAGYECVSFEMFGIFWLCKKSPCPVSQDLHDPPWLALASLPPSARGDICGQKTQTAPQIIHLFWNHDPGFLDPALAYIF